MSATADRSLRWHPETHSSWAYERLVLARLEFLPTYDPESVASSIDSVCQEMNIQSFSLMEMTGEFDSVLEVWLPPRVTVADLLTKLRSGAVPKLARLEMFVASGPPTIWIRQDDLLSKVSPGTASPPVGLLEAATREPPDDAAVTELRRQGYLLPAEASAAGVVIEILVAEKHIDIPQEKKFRRELVSTIAGSTCLSEAALHIGESSAWGSYVVTARIEPSALYNLDEHLLAPIRAIGERAGVVFKTRTHLRSKAAPLLRQERLPRSIAADADLPLGAPEGVDLELKGSLFVDWKRYLHGNQRAIVENPDLFYDALVKPVVAMLNTNGGRLIVGVLEARPFAKSMAGDRLANEPRLEDRILVGVRHDFLGKDWDEYERRLRQKLRRHVEPEPLGAVSISLVRAHDRDFAVIEIRPLTTTWYYAHKGGDTARQFLIRDGSSSLELSGLRADAYRTSKPRGLLAPTLHVDEPPAGDLEVTDV